MTAIAAGLIGCAFGAIWHLYKSLEAATKRIERLEKYVQELPR